MTTSRPARLALIVVIVALSVVAAGLLVRLEETGEGLGYAIAAALALIAAVAAAERTTRAVAGGRLTALRGRVLPWAMLGFVLNGGVRTWSLATDAPSVEAVAAVTHLLGVVLGAAVAALLIGPSLERLTSALRDGEARRGGAGEETRA